MQTPQVTDLDIYFPFPKERFAQISDIVQFRNHGCSPSRCFQPSVLNFHHYQRQRDFQLRIPFRNFKAAEKLHFRVYHSSPDNLALCIAIFSS